VVPLAPSLGTWRDAGVFAAADWHKLPSNLPLPAAATITIKWVVCLQGLQVGAAFWPGCSLSTRQSHMSSSCCAVGAQPTRATHVVHTTTATVRQLHC
jgi:hypothetical protein